MVIAKENYENRICELEEQLIAAQRAHLEDMRKLVFEGLMPNILPSKEKEEK